MKGLLLAAGLGSRLRPLTDVLPKPLFLYFNRPLLDIAYSKLNKVCTDGIAVNTHHLAESIQKHIHAHANVYTPTPLISHEVELLGTGGAVNPIRDWIGNDSVLVYNSDIVTDIDLIGLLDSHERSGAAASMVLLKQHKPGTTPVYVANSHVYQIGSSASKPPPDNCSIHTFSGVHIFGKSLLNEIPSQGFSSIIEAYQAILTQGGKVSTWIHSGFWEDLGTPFDYYNAHLKLQASSSRFKLQRSLGLDEEINWDEFSKSAWCGANRQSESTHGSFIFGYSQLVSNIRNCIVYPGCIVNDEVGVENQIILPRSRLRFDWKSGMSD